MEMQEEANRALFAESFVEEETFQKARVYGEDAMKKKKRSSASDVLFRAAVFEHHARKIWLNYKSSNNTYSTTGTR